MAALRGAEDDGVETERHAQTVSPKNGCAERVKKLRRRSLFSRADGANPAPKTAQGYVNRRGNTSPPVGGGTSACAKRKLPKGKKKDLQNTPPPTYLKHCVRAGGDGVRASSLLCPALVSLVEQVHYFFRSSGFHFGKPRHRRALRKTNGPNNVEEISSTIEV